MADSLCAVLTPTLTLPRKGGGDKRVLTMRIRCLAVVALLIPFVFAPTRATDPAGPLEQIRPRMQAFVDKGEVAGAVTVVGRRDGVMSIETVGFADVERQRPMTKDTLFRI